MKKVIMVLLCLIFVNQVYAGTVRKSPKWYIYAGSAVIGTELIFIAIKLISGDSKKDDYKIGNNKSFNNMYQGEKIDKEAELKKLLGRSKLFDIIDQTNTTGSAANQKDGKVVIQTNLPKMMEIEVVKKTNIGIKKKKIIVSVSKITNVETKEVFEFKDHLADYYMIGKKHYEFGKPEKGKEYMMRTIINSVHKEKAIEFLKQKHNMSLDEVMKECADYKDKRDGAIQ